MSMPFYLPTYPIPTKSFFAGIYNTAFEYIGCIGHEKNVAIHTYPYTLNLAIIKFAYFATKW